MGSRLNAEEILREIATMPLRMDLTYDEHGKLKEGRAYGEQWAAWKMQEMAKEWIAKRPPGRSNPEVLRRRSGEG